jgi:hypothetical protein
MLVDVVRCVSVVVEEKSLDGRMGYEELGKGRDAVWLYELDVS